jgi:acyl-coenzyme A synthetase/AMP-(fatty) acid ligase
VPKEYVAVEELPKSPVGKILKRELKRSYLEGGKMNGRS